MLVLSIGLLAGQQQHYYTSLASEDYYTQGGEPEGVWFGAGAAALGLEGSVDTAEFGALFSGFAPDGETKLVRNAGSDLRRAGFDLTFNAPKSVSVLFSQAPAPVREAVQAAQAEAVREALEYVESRAGKVRLGRDGVDVERAGMAVAMFEHSSARLVPGASVPDPHLHTHAVVMNLGLTEGGRSGALDSRELLRHKMAAGVLYRAELFRQLEIRLGLRATKRGKFCELEAVPDELCAEFSKRRRSIEDELRARGVTEYGAATSAVALQTRTSKPTVDRAEFLKQWQETGRKFGFTVGEDLLERGGKHPKRDLGSLVEEASTRALSRITEQHSHFAERELVRALADELEVTSVGSKVVLQAVADLLQTPELQAVGESCGETRYSTGEMLQLERDLLRDAAGLVRRQSRLRSETLVQVLRSRPSISEEQLEALHAVTEKSALALVRGFAGTGKTYLMEAAREAWEAGGLEVRGLALAAAAAKRLEDGSGIQSETIHRFLWAVERGDARLTEKSVLVVDEAAMVGTRQLTALVREVSQARAKLVLVGDDRQLQAIEAGAPFASLARRFGAAELCDIRRQRSEWARDAVIEFSRGEARRALRKFRERGLVQAVPTKSEAISHLVEHYADAVRTSGFEETVALAGTWADVRRLAREIQMRRHVQGELGPGVLVGEELFHFGDRVLFRKNSKRLGLLNGDRGEVLALSDT